MLAPSAKRPDTADSSASTVVSPNGAPHRPHSPSLEASLSPEIIRDEAAIEKYGGDDPHEPAVKNVPFSPTSTLTHEEPELSEDPDKVTWDGPDDPENPQNWSVAYRWFITMGTVVMTVNV